MVSRDRSLAFTMLARSFSPALTRTGFGPRSPRSRRRRLRQRRPSPPPSPRRKIPLRGHTECASVASMRSVSSADSSEKCFRQRAVGYPPARRTGGRSTGSPGRRATHRSGRRRRSSPSRARARRSTAAPARTYPSRSRPDLTPPRRALARRRLRPHGGPREQRDEQERGDDGDETFAGRSVGNNFGGQIDEGRSGSRRPEGTEEALCHRPEPPDLRSGQRLDPVPDERRTEG